MPLPLFPLWPAVRRLLRSVAPRGQALALGLLGACTPGAIGTLADRPPLPREDGGRSEPPRVDAGSDAGSRADGGPRLPGDDTTIDGEALGLYSEAHAFVGAVDPSPMLLLYFQSGSQGGVRIYSGYDYAAGGENVWLDKARRGDAPDGDVAMWFRQPALGADSPALDARNASARIVWRTFSAGEGAPFDVSRFRYVNVWIRALDGYEGHVGIELGSWDPAAHGGDSGDAGIGQTQLFPQRITGDGWHCLSLELSSFEEIDLTKFARYRLDFGSDTDGHAFLLDNLTFSVNRPRAAGDPDPDLYRITVPGEDPSTATDDLRVDFDQGVTHQTVRGFGFFGDSRGKRRLLIDMGASLVRVEIPAGDPPAGGATRANTLGWEPVNDDGDHESFTDDLSGFDAPDVAGLIASMRAYQAIDPGVAFFACPWSPPAWMKNGGLVSRGSAVGDWGNSIRSDSFAEYGEYLASFALHLHREGVPLAAISMGNEVHFNHDFPSMRLVGADMLAAVRETHRHLAVAVAEVPGFVRPRLTTDDHVLTDYFFDSGFVPLLEGIGGDTELRSAVDVVSYHNYGVDAQTPENASSTVLARLRGKATEELRPGIELWMTETSGFHNGLLDEGERYGALRMAEGLYTSLVYANTSAWVYFGAEELLYFDRLSWPGTVLKHFARFLRPGAVRFDASIASVADRVLVAAFENASTSDLGRSIAVVIVNKDDRAHGLDLSRLPSLPGLTSYREYRSSIHHACEDMGDLNPGQTASTPYVLPPHGVVTLYQGAAVPTY